MVIKKLNSMIKDKDKTVITKVKEKYQIFHICKNGVPVLLFYSEDIKQIEEEIKIRDY